VENVNPTADFGSKPKRRINSGVYHPVHGIGGRRSREDGRTDNVRGRRRERVLERASANLGWISSKYATHGRQYRRPNTSAMTSSSASSARSHGAPPVTTATSASTPTTVG